MRRDGETVDVTVRTVPSPASPSRPIVGISVDQEADIELPIDVDIDLGRVGGPSAGLPFALEIARMLGRDVDARLQVAATGELALDGTVLPVGGLKQKTIGARRDGCGCLPRPGGGERGRSAQSMRTASRSSLWRVFNRRCGRWQRRLGSADFAGLSPVLRTARKLRPIRADAGACRTGHRLARMRPGR